jgi:hypothetical protein
MIFKPGAKPAQYGATQCVKHSPDHDGKHHNQGEHQERVGASARQHAIVNLKQVDGGSEQEQIVAAAVCKHESKRARAGPKRRLQRCLWRRHHL